MTEAVGGYRGGSATCVEDSLERLEKAEDRLAHSEQKLEEGLGSAIINTVKVAAVCLGNPATVGCVVAATQHFHQLYVLSQQAEQYAREAEEYEAALAEHLACLSR
ncbi:MAG TPA: hypothetical protein VM686_22625 [Polyangiaceae bacterium]|nr:hypothetical protein [Polyangiaceae bacterium]